MRVRTDCPTFSDVPSENVRTTEPDRRTRKRVARRDAVLDLAADRVDARVTVDTAHGFQGDERDVMIFSPAVADGTPPGLARFAANPNLLNVALTRARARTIVVGDLTAARSSSTLLASLATYADRVTTTYGPDHG
mgnify:CR=1 FL=1